MGGGDRVGGRINSRPSFIWSAIPVDPWARVKALGPESGPRGQSQGPGARVRARGPE